MNTYQKYAVLIEDTKWELKYKEKNIREQIEKWKNENALLYIHLINEYRAQYATLMKLFSLYNIEHLTLEELYETK